jgi:hypothetical protein
VGRVRVCFVSSDEKGKSAGDVKVQCKVGSALVGIRKEDRSLLTA